MSNAIHNTAVKSENVKLKPFSDSEAGDIQSRLEKQLGPEYVSTRPGAGGLSVSYIEGWKAINLANAIFGFNGWYSEVKTVQVDYLDERSGRFSVGLSVIVRVTLKDGAYHEDIGYGSLDNARTKSMAFEKAKKEAITDGLKRALRCFGNALGNCLYDKDYLSKISNVKCAPPDFDESNLMRYTDNLAPPSRAATIPAQLPSVTTNNSKDRSSAATLPIPRTAQQNSMSRVSPAPQPARPVQAAPPHPQRAAPSAPSNIRKPIERDDHDDFDDSMTFSDDINLESEDFNDEVNELLNTKLKTPAGGEDGEQHEPHSESTTQEQQTNDTPSRPAQPDVRPSEVSFVKARVAEDLQKNGNVASSHAFNPNFISPSIRRTVDPTKSTPIKRTAPSELKTVRYDNPRLIPNRQIGKPRYPPPKRSRIDSGKENSNNSVGSEKTGSQDKATNGAETSGS